MLSISHDRFGETGTGNHIMTLSSCEFCENWHSRSHSLFLCVNELYTHYPNVCNLDKIQYKGSACNAVEYL